jgi:hypothetical protein
MRCITIRHLGPAVLLVAAAACSRAGASPAGTAGRTAPPAAAAAAVPAGASQPARGAAPGRGTRAALPAPEAPATSAAVEATPATAARAIPARDLALSPGLTLELRSRTALSSRTNHVGDHVTAVLVAPAYADSGTPVIPAGSEFLGTVEAIAPAPNPHSAGTLELAFTDVRVGGALQPIHTRVISVATHLRGRGVTGGTVAKVGAGAAVGGILGKLIGRSTAATVIGAAAGGAAGGVYANATRNLDVIMDRDAPIRLELTEPYAPSEVASRP